jgi:hypothetical protein
MKDKLDPAGPAEKTGKKVDRAVEDMRCCWGMSRPWSEQSSRDSMIGAVLPERRVLTPRAE